MALATHNLWVFNPTFAGKLSPKRAGEAVLLMMFLAVAELQGSPAKAADPMMRAQQHFREAETRYRSQRTNTDAAWQFGRACFDLAEFATNNTGRAELAEQGIAACREAISHQHRSAASHYYLGMNLGQLARTKGLGALKVVEEMQREFILARDLDESIDYAGPDRNLGLLYREAPSVVSVGNHGKAKHHLQRAVELAPEYPENRLDLLEAYLKWNDRNGARRELKALEDIWPRAKAKFAGEAWMDTWADWEREFKTLKKKVEEPPKALQAPRQSQ